MNGNHSYAERSLGRNIGEDLFEQYCTEKQVYFKRIGFDEKNNPVPYFYRINPFIRNVPDYLVIHDKGSKLVNVKGTANFKKSEVDMMPLFLEWYSSKDCPLLYAFCFNDKSKPFFITPDRVIELYQQAQDKQWNDGVVYRTLNFEN
jgi:hypothetical protein